MPAHSLFKSKVQTLIFLTEKLKTGKVLPIYKFSVKDYLQNKESLISSIRQEFPKQLLIIRSSSINEDSVETSNAGHFSTVAGIDSNDTTAINEAIKTVIDSYEDHEKIDQDEVFIQPFLENISCSGVAVTADIDTLAEYYIINYDLSGSNDSVTSGKSGNLKTYIQHKKTPNSCGDLILSTILKTLTEIEELCNHPYLDIEFAIDSAGELFVLQVRPIAPTNKEDLSNVNLEPALSKIYRKIEKLSAPHPNLLGNNAIYGVMPDWNPAEIIGMKPKRLTYSFYKEIITDNIWAYQRDNYGYRNLRSHPLMLMFAGVPFIDVRVDFNSFIPKSLPEPTASKLVNFYLKKLTSQPTFHDKIEFEVVYSCFHFSLPAKLQELVNEGFSKNEINEIKSSLLEVTNRIIDPNFGHFKNDVEKIELLKQKYESVVKSDQSLVDKIYWLIEDCKRYGTLPFAGIARSAFIATQFLNSLVDLKVISEDEKDKFTQSVNTIVKNLNNDLIQLSKKKISKKTFLNKYGHLRPRTYDIESERYDQNYENYFALDKMNTHKTPIFSFSDNQLAQIKVLIEDFGIAISADGLINFVRESIGMREYAKFVFTKSLSMALSLVGEFGERCSIEKKEMAHLDIKVVLNLYSSLESRDVSDILNSDISVNKELHSLTKAIKLPSLITSPEDVYAYHVQSEEPNFVTLKNVIAPVIAESDADNSNIEDKIIFIVAADPGYDYLFTKNIAGLVTQFGGANSHMAVRCAELGIPAVIGAGETKFNAWLNAGVLKIDCLNRQVQVIS